MQTPNSLCSIRFVCAGKVVGNRVYTTDTTPAAPCSPAFKWFLVNKRKQQSLPTVPTNIVRPKVADGKGPFADHYAGECSGNGEKLQSSPPWSPEHPPKLPENMENYSENTMFVGVEHVEFWWHISVNFPWKRS